jgi:hypothetical protein
MNLLQDIITYVRRIIKSPSNSVITDDLIIDYINRFWIMDVDARIQLFDLKTKYQFQTVPGIDKYNMPLYSVQIQPGNQAIGMYPVYQGFVQPVYINGIQVPFQTQKGSFFNTWPNVTQNLGIVGQGNGTSGPYSIQIPILPGNQPQNPPLNGILRGHIDIAGIIATGNNIDPPLTDNINAIANIASVPVMSVDAAVFLTSIDSNGANVVVSDSGWFLDTNVNYGLLMNPGKAPFGNSALSGGYSITSNTINYFTGQLNVTFPVSIPQGNNIRAQVFFFQSGLPRSFLFYNNVITLRSPPDTQYLVEVDAYLSPAAFLNTAAAIPFGYMAEYLSRGAARKILSDTGDYEQFQFYEPLFKEQELLVWKRSQRQWTATRTETIYSQGMGQGSGMNNNFGGSGSL